MNPLTIVGAVNNTNDALVNEREYASPKLTFRAFCHVDDFAVLIARCLVD